VILKQEQKHILLADMNSFFTSCHQSVDPKIRNKPVIVGGSPANKYRGMVIAASYEAKGKGIYTTMSMKEALERCPEAIVVPRDHELYNKYSEKIMDFLRLIGSIEVASIDEAYIEITDRVLKGTSPKALATYIQKTLWEKIHIPCSLGCGPTKIIAKMASEIKKPLGFVELGYKQYQSYFHPQPINELHGCGTQTTKKLNQHHIFTIGQLAKADSATIKIILGLRGLDLQQSAMGISSSYINSSREKGDKTIGQEKTFSESIMDSDYLLGLARHMINQLSNRLEQRNLGCRTISLVFKKERGESSHSKSHSLPSAITDPEEIYTIAERLFHKNLQDTPLSLFGVRLNNLEDMSYKQLTLWDYLRGNSRE
jgi:DNA polymerase-4